MAKEEDMTKALWTLKWYLENDPQAKGEMLDTVREALGLDTDKDRGSVSARGAGELWCPFAQTQFPQGRLRGNYEHGYPEGAIVHFTAGRRTGGLAGGMGFQTSQGKYLYFVIDEEGNIGQNFPLNKWGYHCDPASWPGIDSPLSAHLVGIEVMCAGKLNSDLVSWFGESYPKDQTRYVKRSDGYPEGGHYLSYTDAQEDALIRLLLWLYRNKPDVFKLEFVLGHDEVSPGRKNDPGGSLSMTMPKFRDYLMELADSK